MQTMNCVCTDDANIGEKKKKKKKKEKETTKKETKQNKYNTMPMLALA